MRSVQGLPGEKGSDGERGPVGQLVIVLSNIACKILSFICIASVVTISTRMALFVYFTGTTW
jgi:hypothetical protein